ncbi:hypothetical protein E2C01_020623 [Portunus trituberculatus]|uniref:Uncharacterized protein n=1 Tax=Portunus trituberculatus TaxID=210409 RepID=A0A5B7E2K3_PORTR|nr:hypothetical protein [Portunus trituberculatus]
MNLPHTLQLVMSVYGLVKGSSATGKWGKNISPRPYLYLASNTYTNAAAAENKHIWTSRRLSLLPLAFTHCIYMCRRNDAWVILNDNEVHPGQPTRKSRGLRKDDTEEGNREP